MKYSNKVVVDGGSRTIVVDFGVRRNRTGHDRPKPGELMDCRYIIRSVSIQEEMPDGNIKQIVIGPILFENLTDVIEEVSLERWQVPFEED